MILCTEIIKLGKRKLFELIVYYHLIKFLVLSLAILQQFQKQHYIIIALQKHSNATKDTVETPLRHFGSCYRVMKWVAKVGLIK